MLTLKGALRTYDWGSYTAIAEIQNRPSPTQLPEAELWFGAHPLAPAGIEEGETDLLDLIEQDPAAMLGAGIAANFGERLPFLMKILAAAEPLSLQVHPNSEQARAGFAAENRAGLALGDPRRNYRDASHKPEIVVAVSDFVALAGFREPSVTVRLLQSLDIGRLAPAINRLTESPDESGIRAVMTDWLRMSHRSATGLQDFVLTRANDLLVHGRSAFSAELETVLDLGEKYPGDPGVLVSLLLNLVELRPGQALYMPAGNLHAYVRGTAVEAMASSDNVLRGGLTSKNVDIEELLRILDFTPVRVDQLLPAVEIAGAEHRYCTPAQEFALSRFALTGPDEQVPLTVDGPQIVTVIDGTVEITTRGGDTRLITGGEAVWLSHKDDAATVGAFDGPAAFFRCQTGWRSDR